MSSGSPVPTSVKDYFDLGFQPDLLLGSPRTPRVVWEVSAWLLVAIGMLLRQSMSIPNLLIDPDRLTISRFAAALVIGLAMFPAFMRWLNRRRKQAGLVHVALPFAFGFFLDLTLVAAIKVVGGTP